MSSSRTRFLPGALFALFLVVSVLWMLLAALNGESIFESMLFSIRRSVDRDGSVGPR